MLAEQTEPRTPAAPQTHWPPGKFLGGRLVPVVVWGLWAAMFVALLGFVAVLGHNVPFADDWDVMPWVSGQQPVEPSWLWRHHNEHRIPLPKMVWVVLGRLTGYDVRAGMYLDAVILGAISAALLLGARRLRGRTALSDAFFPLALLHWGQHQTLLWNFEVQFISSAVLSLIVLLTLVSVGSVPTARQGLILGTCLVLLPLCGANGLILVPPLAAWLAVAGVVRWRSGLPHGRRDGALWLGLAGTALGLVALSFLGERAVGVHPESPSLDASIQTACQFFVMALGPGGEMILPFSALGLLLLVALCGLTLAAALYRRTDERWRGSGLLVYLGALLGLGLAVGWGRAGFGGVTALTGTRFVTLAVPLLCWCYFIAQLASAPSASTPFRMVPWLLCAVLLALQPWNIREGLSHGRGQAAILSHVEADIREGIGPAELARRWQYFLYYSINGLDEEERQQLLQERLEWLRHTGQGPYKGPAPR
jgi:hypothetical protein